MPEIEFVRLQKPEKARWLCELSEAFYTRGAKVLITVLDENQGVTLDRFMWAWKKGSFIPHAFDNGAVEVLDEPVVICAEERNSNGARVLIAGRPCSLEFIRQFDHVIDFAELYTDELAAASRQRFLQYRKAGYEPRMRE